MKDKRRKSADTLKRLIETSGGVVDKALDKGSDLAAAMMDHTARLISKLSDDIGIMADRILTMEERIGSMADRIVKTEELMARLTATLADRELDTSAAGLPQTPVLFCDTTETSRTRPPALKISGEPSTYLLLVSDSPLFAAGSTIVSKVASAEELSSAWQRSLSAIAGADDIAPETVARAVAVSVAVKIVGPDQRLSELSNSIDLTVGD